MYFKTAWKASSEDDYFFFHLIVIKLDGNVVDPKKTFKILRLDATPKYYFIDRESIIFET